MEIKKAQLLFEQSGTFKSEFKKLGIPAEDYDIFNDFGETDHVIDLYTEIDSEYKRERDDFRLILGTRHTVRLLPLRAFRESNSLVFPWRTKATHG